MKSQYPPPPPPRTPYPYPRSPDPTANSATSFSLLGHQSPMLNAATIKAPRVGGIEGILHGQVALILVQVMVPEM